MDIIVGSGSESTVTVVPGLLHGQSIRWALLAENQKALKNKELNE
jgi:hypothetical protein